MGGVDQLTEDQVLTVAHGMEQCESSVAGPDEVEVPGELHVDRCR